MFKKLAQDQVDTQGGTLNPVKKEEIQDAKIAA
jgi:hypothetical protein